MQVPFEIDFTPIYLILLSTDLWQRKKRDKRRRRRGVGEEGRGARLQEPQAVSLDSLHLGILIEDKRGEEE